MVDVQFGMAVTWNYFKIFQGRRGIDNLGYTMFGRAHYGNNKEFAGWNGTNLTFGDGNLNQHPFVSLDSVGHEWTHGVTAKTAGLISSMEAGAANESFSDIFGTMIEFSANVYGKLPTTLLGKIWASGSGSVV